MKAASLVALTTASAWVFFHISAVFKRKKRDNPPLRAIEEEGRLLKVHPTMEKRRRGCTFRKKDLFPRHLRLSNLIQS